MSNFGFGWNSIVPSPCPVRIKAHVPSGRAVASANWAAPYRPTPSPTKPFNPTSNFFANRGTRRTAPPPPPVRESLNAPATEGEVAPAAHVSAGPTTTWVASGVGVTTAHG